MAATWRTAGGVPPEARCRELSELADGEAGFAGVSLCLVLSSDGTLPEGTPRPPGGWQGYATLATEPPEVWLNLSADPQPTPPAPSSLAETVHREADGWDMGVCIAKDNGVEDHESSLIADLFHAAADRLAYWDAAAVPPGADAWLACIAHEAGHLLCHRLQESGDLPDDDSGLFHWLAGGDRGATWHPDVAGNWDSCPCTAHAIAQYRKPAEWFAEAWALLRLGHEDELSRFGTGLVTRMKGLPGTGIEKPEALVEGR